MEQDREADPVLARVRIWLPDAPGVLGAVATAIGVSGGNVVGLEVLERGAGVAIDELIVELPDDDDAIAAMCRGIRDVPGAGVEDVVVLPAVAAASECEDTVLAAVACILGAPTPAAVLQGLCTNLCDLFGLTWMALADEGLGRYVQVRGVGVPPVRWVAAFAAGSRCGTDPALDTTGSGVFVEPVAGTGLVICGGRAAAIRRRERHEISTLALAAARLFEALGGRLAAAG